MSRKIVFKSTSIAKHIQSLGDVTNKDKVMAAKSCDTPRSQRCHTLEVQRIIQEAKISGKHSRITSHPIEQVSMDPITFLLPSLFCQFSFEEDPDNQIRFLSSPVYTMMLKIHIQKILSTKNY